MKINKFKRTMSLPACSDFIAFSPAQANFLSLGEINSSQLVLVAFVKIIYYIQIYRQSEFSFISIDCTIITKVISKLSLLYCLTISRIYYSIKQSLVQDIRNICQDCHSYCTRKKFQISENSQYCDSGQLLVTVFLLQYKVC